MRIRTRLFFLLLAMLVPAVVVATIGIAYVYKEQKEAHHQALRETAHALALVLDKEMARREGVLQALAQSPTLDKGDFSAFHSLAQRIAPNWNGTIVLSDAEGQQFLNTRRPYGTQALPRVSSVELRKQYGPEATVVSNLYIAPIGKKPSFSIQVPVLRDGQVLFYLSMGSFASQLQLVFDAQRLPASWTGTIVDRNGIVVARSKNPEKYVGMRAGDKMYKKIMSSTQGFNEGPTLSGEMVNAFFSRAPQSGWAFIVSVPEKEIQRGAIEAAAFLTSGLLVLLGFAVAAAYAAGRRTAKPIEALRLSAEQLGQGMPIEARSFDIVEMDEVHAAMVKASAEIRSTKAGLEQRVTEAVNIATQSQRALQQAQKLDALGQLTGGIAHDFNNVLQTMTTGLQIAHHKSTDASVKSMLEACQRAADRAGELTRQLMAFGRVQDARVETLDIARQISGNLSLLKGGLRSNIELRIELDEPLFTVTMDPLQFELALLNLTVNARDAMPNGGVLLIKARNEKLTEPIGELRAGDFVRIEIIDDGQGMTQDVLAKAMDSFFSTKDVGKGSGLGLAQAYGFAKQAGGLLMLNSEAQKGTKATIYLPDAGKPAKPQRSAEQDPANAAGSGCILFVEDDGLVRDVAVPALRDSGFRVLVATDAQEALALLDQHDDIDLLFSDIVMPGRVSGIDLAEMARERFPDLRIVLATGYTDRRITAPGVRMLAKPYKLEEILAVMREDPAA
jgi:signal transduction histidine kinase/CheY-like chemotaxis protein